MPYRIKDWNRHFENFKSRSVHECSFVCVPNKIGLGLTRMLTQPDGLAMYGAWVLLIAACSRHDLPREGWCTENGKPDGKPWSAADLALLWRRTEAEVRRALEFISSEEVGWIEQVAIGTRTVSERYPHTTLEGKGREGNEVKEEKEGGNDPATRGESLQPSAEDPDDGPTDFPWFPTQKGKRSKAKRWLLTEAHARDLATTFAAIDVPGECRKAWQWTADNPQKRKTAKGMSDFLRRWLMKEDTHAKRRGGRGQSHSTITLDFTHPEYDPPPLTAEQRKAIAGK